MNAMETLKSFLLAGCIGLCVILQGSPVKAAGAETLTVAGGCFWCVESDFEQVPGVIEAVSGYTGGSTSDPTYKQVTAGKTGHFEAVQIMFDPSIVSRKTLLTMFFRSIDPTDAGGQFCDRGMSYSTAIFVSGAQEKALAAEVKNSAQNDLGRQIVTPILDETAFYRAEDYHQDFYKGEGLLLTRFGPKRKKSAYKAYREACGRDERVRELWGSAAPFAGG